MFCLCSLLGVLCLTLKSLSHFELFLCMIWGCVLTFFCHFLNQVVWVLFVVVYCSITIFWLLQFCSKFWNSEVWNLQLYYLLSGLFWLFGSPWDSIWILGWNFPFKKKCHWDFDVDFIDPFGYYICNTSINIYIK